MDDQTTQHLESLNREELLELIRRIAGRDEAVDREIELFLRRSSPSDHARTLGQWIRRLGGSRRFVPYGRSFKLAGEIEDLGEELEGFVGTGDPAEALQLVESFLEAGETILQSVDDSSGAVSGALRELAVLWLRAARRCRDGGREDGWGDRVQELMTGNDTSLLDNVLPQASILLTEAELRELARRYEAQATSKRASREDSFTARLNLGQLAWPLGDPAVYVRSIRLQGSEPNDLQKAAIVRCHLELEDPEGALEWLGDSWGVTDAERLKLRAAALAALGRTEDLISAYREIWDRSPSRHSLDDLLGALPPEDREALRSEAKDRAASAPHVETGVNLLFYLGEPGLAETLLIQRRRELDGSRYPILRPMAERFEAAGGLLASTVIHRALLLSILERANSRAYSHAARSYSHLAVLAERIEDWGELISQEEYVPLLVTNHGKKRSFWSRVGGLP